MLHTKVRTINLYDGDRGSTGNRGLGKIKCIGWPISFNKKAPTKGLGTIYNICNYLLKAFFNSSTAKPCASFASGTIAAIPKNSCVTPL